MALPCAGLSQEGSIGDAIFTSRKEEQLLPIQMSSGEKVLKIY